MIHCLKKFALPGMQARAVAALGNIGPDAGEALPLLEEMAVKFGDPKMLVGKNRVENRKVHQAIREAIGKITGKEPPSDLPDPDVFAEPSL